MRAIGIGLLLPLLAPGCQSPPVVAPSVPPAPLPAPIGVDRAADDDVRQPAASVPPVSVTQPTGPPPAGSAAILDEVSPARLRQTVDRLAAFGTRHTLSAEAPDRGIAAARDYIATQMREAGEATPERPGGALTVVLDSHHVPPRHERIDRAVDVVNVVATLPGSMPEAAARHYYVVAHYDSRNSDPMDAQGDAPGANDDGSGTALVIELARVLSGHPLDATVVLMTTAGEEQGLLGARGHAQAAQRGHVDVRAVLSNDIVGDPTAPDGRRLDDQVRVFSEGLALQTSSAELDRIRALGTAEDAPSRQLARFVEFVGRWHALGVQPSLRARPDRYLRGGDHTAFNEQGFAAVRFTEMAENYDRQHQDPRRDGLREYGDLPGHVDETYLAGVARLNLAAVVHLANAPSAPTEVTVVATSLTSDTTVRWSPSPEPDVVGYEVVWRPTDAPQWTFVASAGPATQTTLPLSKDDWHFGVRAVDSAGYRSPVTPVGSVAR
jgi:Zn-dependent M28 family amino/carboxypeptidase